MDGGSPSEPYHFFSGSTHRSAGGGLVSRPAANNRMYANSCLLGCFNSPRQAEVASAEVAASSSACRQKHLTRDFFSTLSSLCTHHIVTQGVTRHVCMKRCSCTCHDMFERLLFPCFVFFLCLSCLYFFSHFYLFSVLLFNFHVVKTAEH